MSRNTLIGIFFFCCYFFATGQYDRVWHFGSGAAINFSASPPTSFSGGQIPSPDNSSTVSDDSGNLLFYTNGVKVWTRNNLVMPNGSNLVGNVTAGQCALIIPIPCDTNRYVIFHTTDFAAPGYLHYTVVDMSLNNGYGDVVTTQKNISLGSGWTEKLCAYYNAATNSYWLLTHKWGNNEFVAFKITSSAIATYSVSSFVGTSHTCGTYSGAHDAMGQLTISKDGTRVANALTCSDKFELFDFNLSTGQLSNVITLPGDGNKAWGTAFSPDGQKLYVDAIFGPTVWQYDLTNYNSSAIIASQFSLVTVSTSGYNFGYMELGPDGKLYIARPYTSYLCVVHQPNLAGSSSSLTLSGLYLSYGTSTHGTSRVAYNIPPAAGAASLQVNVAPSMPVCSGVSVSLSVIGASSYTWSTQSSSSSIVVTPTVSTVYTVSTSNSCGQIFSKTTTVTVNPNPQVTVNGPSTLCLGEAAQLQAGGASSYSWATGQITPSISVTPSQSLNVYHVSGANNFGCKSSAAHTLYVYPNPQVIVTGPSTLCIGDTAQLQAYGANSYSWNTGQTGSVISVVPSLNSNLYQVTASNIFGCKTNASRVIVALECVTGMVQNSGRVNSVYPNPSSDNLIVRMDGALLREIKIISVTGAVVKDVPVAGRNEVTIEIVELPPGIYTLILTDDQGGFHSSKWARD